MKNTYFFTGFPGFIATQLMKRLLQSKQSVQHIYVLVLPDHQAKANEQIAAISASEQVSEEMFTVVIGDITKDRLGMLSEICDELQDRVTHVFHLAAIYDLAVPYEAAYQVNVNGTRHVNDWVLTLGRLQRYVYFSTAYVSGMREGVILESELECGQSFKNHYESTKYEAEASVRKLLDQVPVTIIRPGIVKGHSRTGETVKFDGPYFILNLIDRLSFLPVIPYMGQGEAQGNFVPVDYVFDAVMYLSHAETGVGKTYHLTDPKPYTMKEVYRMLMKAYLGKEPAGMLPLYLVKPFMNLAALRKWLRIEKEGLDYFTCMSAYDCSQAQRDLKGSGISCPSFEEAIQPMVAFYRDHKHDDGMQLKIR